MEREEDEDVIRESPNWTRYVLRCMLRQYHRWQQMQRSFPNVTFEGLVDAEALALEEQYAEFWRKYSMHGTPYGTNEEGMWRWTQEQHADEDFDEGDDNEEQSE